MHQPSHRVSVLEMSHSILLITHVAAIQGRLNVLLGDSLLPPKGQIFLTCTGQSFDPIVGVFHKGWGWSTVVECLSERQKVF